MSKISNISGFPEWLPEQKLVEEEVIEKIRSVYKSYGFVQIETPAVELTSTLLAKGVVDKEIFLLKRAADEGQGETDLALHFDLTVPFARYTSLHYSKLSFPFKRFQLQKVWRGERPQKGRFREFYQFDIDTIAQDDLPISCDAEVVSAIDEALTALKINRHEIKINNRKILFGIYEALGLPGDLHKPAITAVDKLPKIGAGGVLQELAAAGVNAEGAERIVEYSKLKFSAQNLEEGLRGLGIGNDRFISGMNEALELFRLVSPEARANMQLDLSMARGLDYYTGTIFETVMPDFPEFGSVCSGGRYDNLTGQFINKKLPGVGASIGLTRLMDLIFDNNLLPVLRKTETDVLVCVYAEEQRPLCNGKAALVRQHGLNCEVFYKSPRLGKQIDYAAARGIRYVLFVQDDGSLEAKDLETKEQNKVSDLADWCRTTARNSSNPQS